MTGMRLSRWTRSISDDPPRGTMTSMTPLIFSIMPTASRSRVGLEPLRVERQAVDQCGADPGALGFGDILGIGGENLICLRAYRGGGFPKAARPGLTRYKRQGRGGIAGAPPDLGHGCGEIGF